MILSSLSLSTTHLGSLKLQKPGGGKRTPGGQNPSFTPFLQLMRQRPLWLHLFIRCCLCAMFYVDSGDIMVRMVSALKNHTTQTGMKCN